MDPYEELEQHPDLTLLFHRLPDGQRGRWYAEDHVIVIDDRQTQAERRCTLMHELVHRMRGDVHVEDDALYTKQERSCHETVARLLIPFHLLHAAMQWGSDPYELAEELWVDQETLQARITGLSRAEAEALCDDEWSVA